MKTTLILLLILSAIGCHRVDLATTVETKADPHPKIRYETSNGLVLVRTLWFKGVDSMVQYDANVIMEPDIALGELSHTNKLLSSVMGVHGIQNAVMQRYSLHLYRTEAVLWDEIMPKVVAVIDAARIR